jgi:hypothetical protein
MNIKCLDIHQCIFLKKIRRFQLCFLSQWLHLHQWGMWISDWTANIRWPVSTGSLAPRQQCRSGNVASCMLASFAHLLNFSWRVKPVIATITTTCSLDFIILEIFYFHTRRDHSMFSHFHHVAIAHYTNLSLVAHYQREGHVSCKWTKTLPVL